MEKSCINTSKECLARADRLKKEIDKLEVKIAQKESEKIRCKQTQHS